MNREDYEDRFKRWWLGKYCRSPFSDTPFKKVVKVEYLALPSGIYGFAVLTFEDGTILHVDPQNAFRPRKCDIEVQENEISDIDCAK